MISPKIVLLIFVSGKIVLTGAKTKTDIDTAFGNIVRVLRTCKNPVLKPPSLKEGNESSKKQAIGN